MTNCPVCNGLISADDLLCKHCHSTLFGPVADSTIAQGPPQSPPPQPPAEPSAVAVTAICPRVWCGQEYTVGTAICPRCFEPLPAAGQARISSVRLVLPGGATVEVVPGRELLIGRDSLDARIADGLDPYDGVSRRHAELTVSETCATVTDLRSTNGTYVDGARAAGAAVPLEPGHHQLGLGREAVIAIEVLAAVSR
jgi:hypothetical protein